MALVGDIMMTYAIFIMKHLNRGQKHKTYALTATPKSRRAGDIIMSETHRATAREIARNHLDSGDALGWFEDLYSRAGEDSSIIPWADLEANPNLVDWLNQHDAVGYGQALKVGSGLGDDAEELARRGFQTTAFDISQSAIAWSHRRFPTSSVSYVVADLFSARSESRSDPNMAS